MRKFFVTFLLFILFFVVSCDSNLKFNNPNDPANHNSKATGELYGECYEDKTCDEGLTCDEDHNICVKENGNFEDPDENSDHDYTDDYDSRTDADSTDTPSDADEDTGNDSDDPGKTTYETCSEIYQCVATCGQNSECQKKCYDNGTAEGQLTFWTMYNCWNNNGCFDAQTNEEFSNCVAKNCYDETTACGLDVYSYYEPYANPYGTAQINISSTYIITDADSQIDQSMVTIGSFISGNIGNSQIVNPDAAQSYYYTMMYTEQGETMMQTAQYFTDSTGQNILNPMVVAITNVTASVGSNYYGLLEENAVGYIMLTDVTVSGSSLNLNCYHAFSEGELTIHNISAAAGSEGALAVKGTINIYSPKNYANGFGDISDQLGVKVCDPQ